MHNLLKHLIAIAAMIITLPLYALPSDSTYTISLITCGPGEMIYELEGHSGLRIKGPHEDTVVNWGLFDFNSPNFVYRFVKGETDYSIGTMPYEYFIAPYIAYGREITEQRLNLTQQQVFETIKLINTNLEPNNRIYRYNYVKDNCATRPLNIIQKAIGDSIIIAPQKEADIEKTTFRNIMRQCHKNYPWYQFGIDLALGEGIDYELSVRETAFAPIILCKLVANASISDSCGNIIPLVAETVTINPEKDGGSISAPTPWYLTPMFVACCLLVITILITMRDILFRSVTRWFDFLLYLMYGLAGCLIAFLVFISEHEATSPNWLLLWLNPFCLMVPMLIWLKKCKGALFYYHFANFAALTLLVIIWPMMNQSGNIAFIPLIVCDFIRSASYIYIFKCNRKRKHLYRVTYSRPLSSRL